jgi:hypothetical protein
MSFIYAKVQTNRQTLEKYILKFRHNKIDGESLIAPRPLPGRFQRFYFALVILAKGSNNHAISSIFAKYSVLSKEDFDALSNEVKFSWNA